MDGWTRSRLLHGPDDPPVSRSEGVETDTDRPSVAPRPWLPPFLPDSGLRFPSWHGSHGTIRPSLLRRSLRVS